MWLNLPWVPRFGAAGVFFWPSCISDAAITTLMVLGFLFGWLERWLAFCGGAGCVLCYRGDRLWLFPREGMTPTSISDSGYALSWWGMDHGNRIGKVYISENASFSCTWSFIVWCPECILKWLSGLAFPFFCKDTQATLDAPFPRIRECHQGGYFPVSLHHDQVIYRANHSGKLTTCLLPTLPQVYSMNVQLHLERFLFNHTKRIENRFRKTNLLEDQRESHPRILLARFDPLLFANGQRNGISGIVPPPTHSLEPRDSSPLAAVLSERRRLLSLNF
ncbi:hypothetical protein VNO77_41859 [Canavalia gladiata]|uniref:Uncharacterized protein n=1 Tax=Canavalia gladiata TaxID=3824 RepID=A0AAN9K283_CANGL